MSFKFKDTAAPIPTHMKFITQNPESIGKTFDINLILLNSDWKAITFFTEEFKFNLKSSTAEEFVEYKDSLYKSLRRGFCKAEIIDTSKIDPKTFQVEVVIDSMSEDKGGRKYELGKNRISIAPKVVN